MGVVGDPLPGTPDYFNTCAPYVANVPDNFAGYQPSFEGNAYMGLYTYLWYNFWREVIGTQLIGAMILGQNYHISIRVSRGNWTSQAYNCSASNNLGILLSTANYTVNNPPPITNHPSVWEDSIVADTISWNLLQWNLIADSAYSHLYIGNFFTDAQTDTLVINAPFGQFGQAYYFIDSVNVICIGEHCNTGIESVASEGWVWFDNDSKNLIVDLPSGDRGVLQLFNSAGQLIVSENISGNSRYPLAKQSAGWYVAVVKTKSEVVVKKVVVN